MTKRWLSIYVYTVIGMYAVAIVVGIVLKVNFPAQNDPVYSTYKDLIPFFIAIPAAWLGYCFSQRLAYLQHLRALWSQINSAVQQCVQYTHLQSPTQKQYSEVLSTMSTVIDEIRGVFKNIGERPDSRGLYPFEEIKGILRAVSDLGFGCQYDSKAATEARQAIIKQWQQVQKTFLREVDREEPTYPSSPFNNS